MKRSTIIFFAVVLAFISLVDRPSSTLAHAGTDYCLDTEEAAFLVLINDYRKANNLAPLVASHDLGAAAEHHSDDMADQNYFSHTGKNGSTPKERMVDHGYAFDTFWGENISAGRVTAQDAFNAWKASPGHNANMLGPNFVAIGIDRAQNPASEFEFYWTNVFGGEADAAAKPCPANEADAADDPDPAAPKPDPAAPKPGQPDVDDADDQDEDANGDDAAPMDRDDDGLYDDDETDYYNTDPNEYDTDGDGVGDGEEVYNATDPLDATDGNAGDGGDEAGHDSGDLADRDEDGLYDDDETDYYGTDPDEYDTDGDGSGDGEEIYYGTDPLDEAA